jgi:hypothetical protein
LPSNNRWRSTTVVLLVGAALLVAVAACDSTPGAPAILPEPPALDGFAVSPDSFRLEGAAPSASILLTLTGTVTSPDGGPVTLQYLVRRQGAFASAIEGAIEVAAAGPFQAIDTLTVPRGASGLYVVEAIAVGRNGRAGGRASDLLRFTIDPLGAPTVANVVLDPPIVNLPASGTTSLRVVATIADPDGLENVGYVAFQPAGGGPQIPMSDAGPIGQSGDATAGDGQYTVTLDVAAGTPVGQYPFEVVARDREGLEAPPFPVTIVVQ